ncbi:calcium/sodium antiporter [Hornefia porci]
MLINTGILILGFVLLIKGADFFVDGSSSIAKTLLIPPLVIGLTIVAMGTSLPELSVSVVSSLQGNNELSVSNVTGSNLFNLVVVLGASALILPLNVDDRVLRRDFPISILCTAGLMIMCYKGMCIGRFAGTVLCAAFVLYIIYTVRAATKSRKARLSQHDDEFQEAAQEYRILPMWQSVLYVAGGAVAVKFGGDFVVDSASYIAKSFGLSETLIGLTIVACGTSLPELVTSIQATRKGELDLAIGNVIGSNIFNILFILGVAAFLSPIAIVTANLVDMGVLIVVSLIVWGFCSTKKSLSRREGVFMLIMYTIYLVYIILRK